MAKFDLNLPGKEPDEIILNRHGDKISVSADDAGLWQRFLKGCKEIVEISGGFSASMGEIKVLDTDDFEAEAYKAVEASGGRMSYCVKAAEIIDGIFGEGTLRKSFRDDYDKMPNFVPDEERIIAFFETIAPIMEEIFGKKIERLNQESKARMEKYIPQDHKRKEKKGKK